MFTPSITCYNYTEGRPDRTGLRLANELAKLDVPVKLLIDSAVAYSMDEVDMIFVGADGVVESGGIINMMGTYQIALVAHSMSKPVYVAAESYKVDFNFQQIFPIYENHNHHENAKKKKEKEKKMRKERMK